MILIFGGNLGGNKKKTTCNTFKLLILLEPVNGTYITLCRLLGLLDLSRYFYYLTFSING